MENTCVTSSNINELLSGLFPPTLSTFSLENLHDIDIRDEANLDIDSTTRKLAQISIQSENDAKNTTKSICQVKHKLNTDEKLQIFGTRLLNYRNFLPCKFSDLKPHESRTEGNSSDHTTVEKRKMKLKVPFVRAHVLKEIGPSEKIINVIEAFKAEPSEIIFTDFQVNTTYQKKFKLLNISKQSRYFTYLNPPRTSSFQIDLLSETNYLAAGMSAHFLVSFSPKFPLDLDNFKLVFISNFNTKTTVLIQYRELGPNVRFLDGKWDQIYLGSCLIGGTLIRKIPLEILPFSGRRFFILTHSEWMMENYDGKSLQNCGKQIDLEYVIFPTCFTYDLTHLHIGFLSETIFGRCTKQFVLLSDQNSYRYVDLITDNVYFQDTYFRIEATSSDIEIIDGHILKIAVENPRKQIRIQIIIDNISSLHFSAYWIVGDDLKINLDWLRINRARCILKAHSKSEFNLVIFQDKLPDFPSNLSLFLEKIPLTSIPNIYQYVMRPVTNLEPIQDQDFLESLPIWDDFIATNSHSEFIDIQICEFHLNLYSNPDNWRKHNIITYQKKPLISIKPTVYDFGKIIVGQVKSCDFLLENSSRLYGIKWRILEIHFGGNHLIYMSEINCTNFDSYYGVLVDRKSLKYTTGQSRLLGKWWSILVVFSKTSGTQYHFTASTFCILMGTNVFELPNISLSTETNSNLPLLLPKKYLITNEETLYTIYIWNQTALSTGYYFKVPPYQSLSKIDVKIHRKCGVLKPFEKIAINLKLIPFRQRADGPFHIKIPLLGDDYPSNIILYIMGICLENVLDIYDVLWPPKAFQYQQFLNSLSDLNVGSEPNPVEIWWNENLQITDFYPHLNRTLNGRYDSSTFSIRNYGLNTLNFHVKIKNFPLNSSATGLSIKIVPQDGVLEPKCVLKVTLNVNASAWGQYYDLIQISFGNYLPKFCFHLDIDVREFPLVLLVAPNSRNPQIRFGTVAPSMKRIEKIVRIRNISTVPIFVMWYTFCMRFRTENPPEFNCFISALDRKFTTQSFPNCNFDLIITDSYCGEIDSCFTVEPSSILVPSESVVKIRITFEPIEYLKHFNGRTIRGTLVGLIYLESDNRSRDGVFYRSTGNTLGPLNLHITGIFGDNPHYFELIDGATEQMVFVHNVIYGLKPRIEFELKFRTLENCEDINNNNTKLDLFIRKPFEVSCPYKNLNLKSGQIFTISICCCLLNDYMMRTASNLYIGGSTIDFNPLVPIVEELIINPGSIKQQVVPLTLYLQYPKIDVKPLQLLFDQVLLDSTKEMVFTIYNLTGGAIRFEVEIGFEGMCFGVRPFFGEIPPKIGVNPSFVDVIISFTPRKCGSYNEVVTIRTTFPEYFLELPISGHGVYNEKFVQDVSY